MNQRAHLEADMAALFAAGTKFLIVDTETTGLLSDQPGQIIEISMINQDGHVAFSRLFKPDCAVPAKATAVHGLRDADLADAPTFASAWSELLTILVQYPVIFAYNVNFDRGMLLKTARHYGLDIPDWLAAQEWRCMMEAYATYHGDWHEYHQSYTYQKLSVACAALRVPLSELHRATGDALNTLGLMKALAARGQKASDDEDKAWHAEHDEPLSIKCKGYPSPAASEHPGIAVSHDDGESYVTFGETPTQRTEGDTRYFTLSDGAVFVLKNRVLYQQGEEGYEEAAPTTA